MGLGDFADKAKQFADQHDEQVDQGLDRAGDEGGKRLAGHESQVDGLVDKAKQYTGEGDTTAAPTDAAPEGPTEGADQAQEVPGGPQVDVPAESGNVPPQE
jgi:antitoxin protein of toxin-antitoxin system